MHGRFSSWIISFLTINLLLFTVSYWWLNIPAFLTTWDVTYISHTILILFEVVSVGIGLAIVRDRIDIIEEYLTDFMDYFITLGLIGTLIGMMIVFLDGFAAVDLTDVTNAGEAIKKVSIGMGTALITTLTGLIASLVLKVQIKLSVS